MEQSFHHRKLARFVPQTPHTFINIPSLIVSTVSTLKLDDNQILRHLMTAVDPLIIKRMLEPLQYLTAIWPDYLSQINTLLPRSGVFNVLMGKLADTSTNDTLFAKCLTNMGYTHRKPFLARPVKIFTNKLDECLKMHPLTFNLCMAGAITYYKSILTEYLACYCYANHYINETDMVEVRSTEQYVSSLCIAKQMECTSEDFINGTVEGYCIVDDMLNDLYSFYHFEHGYV